MAKTESQLQFTFKTKAFQDYYNRNYNNPESKGAIEFLQGMEEDIDYFNLMKDSYEILGYESCSILYDKESNLFSSVHIFTIKRIDPTYIPYDRPLSEDDQINILEAILGPDYECEGNLCNFINAGEYTYLTIINEG